MAPLQTGVGLIFLVLLMIGYFVPVFVVLLRKGAAYTPVILINLLLGWTVIGWVVALIWAFSCETEEDEATRKLAMERIAAGYPPLPPQS